MNKVLRDSTSVNLENIMLREADTKEHILLHLYELYSTDIAIQS